MKHTHHFHSPLKNPAKEARLIFQNAPNKNEAPPPAPVEGEKRAESVSPQKLAVEKIDQVGATAKSALKWAEQMFQNAQKGVDAIAEKAKKAVNQPNAPKNATVPPEAAAGNTVASGVENTIKLGSTTEKPLTPKESLKNPPPTAP